jgi:dihydropteroate synthase
VSIDTYKARVARAAVEAGAEIANYVSGLRWDAEMAPTLAGLRCGVVLMHMRGRPAEWRTLPPLADPVGLVSRELREGAEAALAAGIGRERIVLDPGFGFGKSFDENYPLLAHFDELHQLGFPLLAGVSRKSFIGRTLARNGSDAPPQERLYGSLAAITAAILKGAHIVRVHDVKAAAQAARIADAIARRSPPSRRGRASDPRIMVIPTCTRSPTCAGSEPTLLEFCGGQLNSSPHTPTVDGGSGRATFPAAARWRAFAPPGCAEAPR